MTLPTESQAPLAAPRVPSIDEVIDQKIGEVRTDAFDLTFGEILNLHKSKELIIRPEYQRLFRWTEEHCCPRHWRRRRFPQHKHLISRVSAAPPKSRLAGGRAVLSEATTGHPTTTGGQENPAKWPVSGSQTATCSTGEAPVTHLSVQFDNLDEADNSDLKTQ